MPFAVRNEDGWRLCLRKGGTFTHVNREIFPLSDIKFPSNAAAKKCADDLNVYWDDWDRAFSPGRKRKTPIPRDVFEVMLMTVAVNSGISKDTYREIINA